MRETAVVDRPADAPRLLRRARADLGSTTALADLLGVPRPTVARWLAGDGAPAPAATRVLADVVAVHARLRVLPRGRVPAGWMRLPCAALGGAAPEDVLVVDGAAPVLEAIERELAG